MPFSLPRLPDWFHTITITNTMSTDAVKQTGGLKGVIQRTGKFFFASGMYARDRGKTALKWGYVYGGKTAFSIAITSMVVFMPLLFEIAREGQVRLNFLGVPFAWFVVWGFWAKRSLMLDRSSDFTDTYFLSMFYL